MPEQVSWRHLWFPLLLLLVVQLMVVWQGRDMLAERGLRDTDTYMRLVRVEELAAGGGWFNGTVERANAPFGDTLHWTRPLDILLLAGAAPLMPVLGTKSALYWWGVAISPVLHWAFVAALIWAAAAVLRGSNLVYAGILAVTQPALFAYFLPARPDHHSLIAVLFAILLGCVLRLLTPAVSRRIAVLAGLVAGLALWVSIEALVAFAASMGILAAVWITGRRVPVRYLLAMCGTVLTMLVIAVMVEHGMTGLFVAEFDRISVVHVLLFAMLTGFWALAAVLERQGWLRRAPTVRGLLCLGGAIAVVAVMNAVYPAFLRGPTAAVDPRVMAVWFAKVNEVAPIIRAGHWGESLHMLASMLGPVFIAAPYAVMRWYREPAERWSWGAVLAMLAVFLPLSLYQVRWATYAEAVVVLPYAAALGDVLAWAQRRVSAAGRHARLILAVVRAEAVVLFACTFLVVPALFGPAAADKGPKDRCDLNAAVDVLHTVRATGEPTRIMTSLFFGPELLYRTSYSVVGTPYHRNAQGILDTYDFFRATDDAAAQRIARHRGIDLVMVCTAPGEGNFYRQGDAPLEPMLHERLVHGQVPAWLEAIPSSDGDEVGPFLLFRVVGAPPA